MHILAITSTRGEVIYAETTLKLHYINYSNKVVVYHNILSFQELLDCCDIYFENNLESNVWTLEYNVEEL